jgi:ABC-type multidrug transport system fused ATPase/permease subunit
LLEGINIKDYDLHHLRRSFGVVSQEPVLFNESVSWNIRYNIEDATEEQIYAAATEANFITRVNRNKKTDAMIKKHDSQS